MLGARKKITLTKINERLNQTIKPNNKTKQSTLCLTGNQDHAGKLKVTTQSAEEESDYEKLIQQHQD